MSDLTDEEIIATRKLHGLDDNLFKIEKEAKTNKQEKELNQYQIMYENRVEEYLKENKKINSLIKKLEEDSEERQWIQTADDEYLAYTEKAMYADELLSFLRGEE